MVLRRLTVGPLRPPLLQPTRTPPLRTPDETFSGLPTRTLSVAPQSPPASPSPP